MTRISFLFWLLLLIASVSALNWFHHEEDESMIQKAKDTATNVKESIKDAATNVKESLKDTGKKASSTSSTLFHPYAAIADWWEHPSRSWPHSVANWGQSRSFPNEYVIYLDVPGIPKEELEVRVKGHRLRVRGTHGTCVAGSGEIDRYCLDRQVERSFTVPEDVEVDHIDALLKDGMLMIKLPRLQDDATESESEVDAGDSSTSLFGSKKLRGKRIGVKDYKPSWRERAKEAVMGKSK